MSLTPTSTINERTPCFYAFAHPMHEAIGTMFSICPSVRAWVRARVEAFSGMLAVDFQFPDLLCTCTCISLQMLNSCWPVLCDHLFSCIEWSSAEAQIKLMPSVL